MLMSSLTSILFFCIILDFMQCFNSYWSRELLLRFSEIFTVTNDAVGRGENCCSASMSLVCLFFYFYLLLIVVIITKDYLKFIFYNKLDLGQWSFQNGRFQERKCKNQYKDVNSKIENIYNNKITNLPIASLKMHSTSNNSGTNKGTFNNCTIDFRNCKYHGQVRNLESGLCPKGFGIVLDQNYTWIAAHWESFKVIQAPSAVVFSDSDKIYSNQGFSFNSVFQYSFVIYESQRFRIYKYGEQLILDLLDYQEQKQHYQNSLFKFNIKKEQSKKKNEPYIYNLQLMQHKIYVEENRQQKISQLANTQGNEQVQFEEWLRKNLRNNLSIFPNSHSKTHANRKRKLNELYVELLNQESSIGLRMVYKKRFQPTKMYFSTKNQVISKKWTHYEEGGYLVEELIGGQLEHYVQYEDLHQSKSFIKKQNYPKNQNQLLGRPNEQVYRECTKNLQQYYKRSLNFTNKYLSLSFIYNLKHEFQQIFNICLGLLQQEQITARQNRKTLISYLKNKQNWQQQRQKQKEQEISNQSHIYQASIDDIKKQIIKTQMLAKSKSRILGMENSNIKSAQNKSNLTPSNRKHSPYQQRNETSKPLNQSMFKTNYQAMEGLIRKQKEKNHLKKNDNSEVKKYEYFFDEEDTFQKNEPSRNDNLRFQNRERKLQDFQLPPSLRMHELYGRQNSQKVNKNNKDEMQYDDRKMKQYRDYLSPSPKMQGNYEKFNQQEFPYRYEPIKQNMFKPLVSKPELRNNQYSRDNSGKEQSFYTAMNVYPTNSTSFRSNPHLEALTMNYENIEHEISQFEKEKQKKLKIAAKNASTKQTTARSNKFGQDEVSRDNSASKSQSRSPSPFAGKDSGKPSKISQVFQKEKKKTTKSRYLKI